MIKPPPQNYKCPKCSYSRVVAPKSDALTPADLLGSVCPKCKINMDRIEMNIFDNIINLIKGKT